MRQTAIPAISLAGALIVATTVATPGFAQTVPFKANVVMKDASDGSTATGVMYFSGSKMRTELEKDGESVIVLIDPASQSHTLLMPSERIFMPLPMGQGPINVSISGPSDPTNPCSSGGNTDCVQGPPETVNGYATIRWDYTAPTGVRTRAWVSTKLRFPIKTRDDDGSSMEFTGITEGPQPASLFAVPADYASVDLSAMGGRGMRGAGVGAGRGGRGRGRGDATGMGGVLDNLPPEVAAAMAAAMKGDGPKGSAPTGSDWEKGKGWILNLTIVGRRTKQLTSKGDPSKGTHYNTMDEELSYTVKLVGSAPLNHGSPSVGVPGMPGPQWMHMQIATAFPDASKVPVSFAVTSESVENRKWTSDCVRTLGQRADPGKSTVTMNGSSQVSVPTVGNAVELRAEVLLQLSSDLKSYDLRVSFIPRAGTTEVTKTHTELTGCDDKKVRVEAATDTGVVEYRIPDLQLKGTLPAAVSTVTGSQTMRVNPLRSSTAEELDATITWTLTPIR